MTFDDRRSDVSRQWANVHGLPPVQAFAAAFDAAIQSAQAADADAYLDRRP